MLLTGMGMGMTVGWGVFVLIKLPPSLQGLTLQSMLRPIRT